ncbi:MAG: hypothetical protein E7339_07910 [Clostridiales bacterium]|nr:hypothetical protein [Clostridiales bacterium]
MKKNVFLIYLKNILLPCLLFSLITGILTGGFVVGFKFIAGKIIDLSTTLYSFLRLHAYYLPLVFALVALVSVGLYFLHKYSPDSKGGGIPNSIAYLRGLVTFKWLRTLIGAIVSCLFTFFIGTPLGNEGPCVMTGTTLGRGVINTLGKKHREWDRYIMTGGACAGFASATGAPISGILFALEEAHHKLSPMILMVAGSTVCFAMITTQWLSSLFGLESALFPHLAPITLQFSQMWLPLTVGIFAGIFAVLYIKHFNALRKLVNKKIIGKAKILAYTVIFILTVTVGLFSNDFISTGHHLIEKLLTPNGLTVLFLILVLVIRTLLTSSASSVSITGGTFIPTLAFGALLSSIIAKILISLGFIEEYYYQITVLLGMIACFSGMAKTPLTAIVFGLEALSLTSNVLAVAITVIASYIISEIFCPHSVNDEIMEIRVEEERKDKQVFLIDAVLTVQEKSFAVGKQIRDVLWPNNLFVLSLKRSDNHPQIDGHGEKNMYPGDKLHVRYSTYDKQATAEELSAILGKQDFTEDEWKE